MRAIPDLKSLFYASLDASAITTLITRLSKISEAERRFLPGFLGEGVHFQSFELASHPIPLVVNVGKASFLKRGDASLRRWQQAIRLACSIDEETLVPPMDIVNAANLTAIVMPKGQDVAGQAAKSLDRRLIDTAKALGHLGLVLDDYPQIREIEGVPFIIDWSDLGFMERSTRASG